MSEHPHYVQLRKHLKTCDEQEWAESIYRLILDRVAGGVKDKVPLSESAAALASCAREDFRMVTMELEERTRCVDSLHHVRVKPSPTPTELTKEEA